MAKSLLMGFMNEDGKKVSLRIDGIREDLTESQVSAVMDTIVSKNIFQSSGGDFKIKDSAEIYERTSEKLDVK